MTAHHLPPPSSRGDDVRRAWWCLALFVPSLVSAFVVGEGLLALLGHGNDQTVPAGMALLAGTPALLVFALPVLAVWHFARRAQVGGHPEGRAPLVLALVLSAGFAAMNLVQLVVGLFA